MAGPVGRGPATLEPFGSKSPPGAQRRRFGFAYALLALAFGGAVGAFVVQLQRGSKPPPVAWSAWQPTTSDAELGAQEIADFVAGRYRFASGAQLVGVVASPFRPKAVQGLVLRAEEPLFFEPRQTQMYALCGLGDACAMNVGTPSRARFELMRREALELALYTFKYAHGVDAVVVFFPPPPKGPQPSLFFRRSDLDRQLDRPLVATLRPKTQLVPGRLTDTEVALIDRLTDPSLFRFDLQRLRDGRPVLVFEPGT